MLALPPDGQEALDWRLAVMQTLLAHGGSLRLSERQAAAEHTLRRACFRWRYLDERLALQALDANRERERVLRLSYAVATVRGKPFDLAAARHTHATRIQWFTLRGGFTLWQESARMLSPWTLERRRRKVQLRGALLPWRARARRHRHLVAREHRYRQRSALGLWRIEARRRSKMVAASGAIRAAAVMQSVWHAHQELLVAFGHWLDGARVLAANRAVAAMAATQLSVRQREYLVPRCDMGARGAAARGDGGGVRRGGGALDAAQHARPARRPRRGHARAPHAGRVAALGGWELVRRVNAPVLAAWRRWVARWVHARSMVGRYLELCAHVGRSSAVSALAAWWWYAEGRSTRHGMLARSAHSFRCFRLCRQLYKWRTALLEVRRRGTVSARGDRLASRVHLRAVWRWLHTYARERRTVLLTRALKRCTRALRACA